MSAKRVIEVSLTDEEYERAVTMARKREMAVPELFRELFRIYRIEEPRRARALTSMGDAYRRVQEESAGRDLDRTTLDEIGAEIAAARRERAALVKSA